jgi:hypothetical protein
MVKESIFIARDGKRFGNEDNAKLHEYKNCMRDNEAFVVFSGFYGQFRAIFKKYEEVVEFIEAEREKELQFKVIELGKYMMIEK